MQQKQKRGKRPNNTPSRLRYWSQGRLAKRKARRLERCNGVPPEKSREVWLGQRKGRVPEPLRELVRLTPRRRCGHCKQDWWGRTPCVGCGSNSTPVLCVPQIVEE